MTTCQLKTKTSDNLQKKTRVLAWKSDKKSRSYHQMKNVCGLSGKPFHHNLRHGLNEMAEWVLSNGRNYHPVTFDGLELNQGKLPPSWASDKDYITDHVSAHTEVSDQYQGKIGENGDEVSVLIFNFVKQNKIDFLQKICALRVYIDHCFEIDLE